MDGVNKTLYIPLYGKAYVSSRGILLRDPKAEQIWAAEGFSLKGKSASKWLAYYMAMRAGVFDRWTAEQISLCPGAVVLHLGCGMDSRCLRVLRGSSRWVDVDFPDVIAQRRRYYPETENYALLAADLRQRDWLGTICGEQAIVVMEGISMYLAPEELVQLLHRLCTRFREVRLLMDCYSSFAAKASRFKNPINDVGVTRVYGLDDPKSVEQGGLRFVREHTMTPEAMIAQLDAGEQRLFRKLYAGGMARRMYRLYEYRKEESRS